MALTETDRSPQKADNSPMPAIPANNPQKTGKSPLAHVAVYDKSSAGIASAALDADISRLIVLHRRGDNTEGLKRVMRDRGIACDAWEVSFDPEDFRQKLNQIFKKYNDLRLQFNASSGYRLMAVLALEAFRSRHLPIFVIDKYTDQWHWVYPRDQASHHLAHRLKIHEYLRVFNAEVTHPGQRQGEPASQRKLTQWLVNNVERLSSALATLNHMAMRATSEQQHRMEPRQADNPLLRELLAQFEHAGLLRVNGRQVDFMTEQNRFYANGGWLENHVFAVIYGLRHKHPSIQDLARGVEIARGDNSVRNELDVTAMAHNRLHIIECKTRRFTHRKDSGAPGASAVYRLGSLKDLLGGLSAKAMLVSYQPLSRYTEQRATDLGIFHCAHEQLHRLPFHLQNFFEQEKPLERKNRKRHNHPKHRKQTQ